MKRFLFSILFFVLFSLCVKPGFGEYFTPPVEVVMGRFCMMNSQESDRKINTRPRGERIQITPNPNRTVNISYAIITPQFSSWLEVTDGFGIDAFWVDSKSRDYISFHQPLGNGEILLETGVLTEKQQKELGNSVEKVPAISRYHGASPTIRNVKNVWELIFFLPPEGEEALGQVLRIKQSKKLELLRKDFLSELIQSQKSLEDGKARPPKSLNVQLEEGRELIRELDSDSFQTRRLADAKLRKLGGVVIMLAGETDWSELSPEAERRFTFIVQETNVLEVVEESLLLEVQRWSNSPRIWAAALIHGTNPQKKIAWEVLEKNFPDLFEKKLRSIGLDLNAGPMEKQNKIQKIFEAVQEEE